MNRSLTGWLSRALYISPIGYRLCVTERAFHAQLKRLKVPREMWAPYLNPHAGATTHIYRFEKQVFILVTIETGTQHNMEETYALLVHEAVHVWQTMREHMGEENPASEQEAYAIQRISLELMVSYREQMKGHASAPK